MFDHPSAVMLLSAEPWFLHIHLPIYQLFRIFSVLKSMVGKPFPTRHLNQLADVANLRVRLAYEPFGRW